MARFAAKSVGLLCVLLPVTMTASRAGAQVPFSPEQQIILQFADNICGTYESSGTKNEQEYSAELSASLSALTRSLVSAGVESAAKFNTSRYEGVLQQHLASERMDTRACRQFIYTDISSRMKAIGNAAIDSNDIGEIIRVNEQIPIDITDDSFQIRQFLDAANSDPYRILFKVSRWCTISISLKGSSAHLVNYSLATSKGTVFQTYRFSEQEHTYSTLLTAGNYELKLKADRGATVVRIRLGSKCEP